MTKISQKFVQAWGKGQSKSAIAKEERIERDIAENAKAMPPEENGTKGDKPKPSLT